MAKPRKLSISILLETWSPLVLAVATFFALVVFEPETIELFKSNELSLPQLYTAIFGWASVMTGFQFGVYSLILSKTDGFIAKISTTKAMSQFMIYTKKAVSLGFTLTILGIPFLVTNNEMNNITNIWYWLGSAYVSLFVYSFAATIRVASLFAAMAKIRTRISLPA